MSDTPTSLSKSWRDVEHRTDLTHEHITVVVLGCSGDLAKRKIFPALFSLELRGLLPECHRVIGFARSKIDVNELRKRSFGFMQKMYKKVSSTYEEGKFIKALDTFFSRVYYIRGYYDKIDCFKKLGQFLDEKEKECDKEALRLFYFSLPPHVFLDAAKNIAQTCKLTKERGHNRCILEKPFGRSLRSYRELDGELGKIYTEEEIYRIDHYIGKEVVQNLIAMRFANIIFDSLWSRNVIKGVQIVFKEQLGVEGRGGYFDNYGIIRDVMQNHMMQIVSYIAMEPPISLSHEDIAAEKTKVLKAIKPLGVDDIVIGQYEAKHGSDGDDPRYCGYREDPSVPDDSNTETFCACVMFIKNRRWDGVPFMLKCGKALDEGCVEIRMTFHAVPANIFTPRKKDKHNELVIRVQPNEGIYFNLLNKKPGLTGVDVQKSKLDFRYQKRWKSSIPDAYERLILNCFQGQHANFVNQKELELSWKIFDKVLTQMERKKIPLEEYPLGSRGPVEADYLVARFGQKWII